MANLLEIGMREIGTKEVRGAKHNSRIIEYAQQSGFHYINDDETPWCSIFMNWVARKASLESSGKANARSWLNVGLPIPKPEPGDVVVFWRDSLTSYKGHVGIFMGYSEDNSRIYTLGGNQGDMVKESAYPSSQLLGFRRLRPTKKMEFPEKLKIGDRGSAVIDLQDALKIIGLEPGTSDGIFGPRTESALKIFQANHADLPVTGTFDEPTREKLAEQVHSV